MFSLDFLHHRSAHVEAHLPEKELPPLRQHEKEEKALQASLRDRAYRFWIASISVVLLLALDKGMYFVNEVTRSFLMHPRMVWVQCVLAVPVVLFGGAKAWKRMREKTLTPFALAIAAVVIAFSYSVLVMVMPQSVKDGFGIGPYPTDLYFEETAVIVVLLLFAEILELRTHIRDTHTVRSLRSYVLPRAHKLHSDGTEEEVPLSTLTKGDHVRVYPNERMPVDGMVVSGSSPVDLSMITGEKDLSAKTGGDKVMAATINAGTTLTLRAENVGDQTLISRIAATLEKAEHSRTSFHRFAEKCAGYVMVITLAALFLMTVLWWVNGVIPGLHYVISMLLIMCPYAFIFGVHKAFVTALARGAEKGIIMQDAQGFECFTHIDTLILPKTSIAQESNIVKDKVKETLRLLKAAGIRVVMITGDPRPSTRMFTKRLGIEDVEADVALEQKVQIIKKFQEQGAKVGFVSGGAVQDIPALMQSDIGIILTKNPDVSLEGADITLLRGNLRNLIDIRDLSVTTMHIVHQNLVWASMYNIVALLGTVLSFSTNPGGGIGPVAATCCMIVSVMIPGWNSRRLKKWESPLQ